MHKISFSSGIALISSIFISYNANAQEGYSPYSGTISSDFEKGGKFDLSTSKGLEKYNEFYPIRTTAQMKYNADLALQLNKKGDNSAISDLKLAFSDIILNFSDIAKDSKLFGSELYNTQSALLGLAKDMGDMLILYDQLSIAKKSEKEIAAWNSTANQTIKNIKDNLIQFNKHSDKLNETFSMLAINSIVTTISMPLDLGTSSIKFIAISTTPDETTKKNIVNMVDIASAIRDAKDIYGTFKKIGGYANYAEASKTLDQALIGKILNNSENVKALEKTLSKGSYSGLSFPQQAKLKNELIKSKNEMLSALKSSQDREKALELLKDLSIESGVDASKTIVLELYKQFSANPGFSSIWENALKVADIDISVYLPRNQSFTTEGKFNASPVIPIQTKIGGMVDKINSDQGGSVSQWATTTMQNQLSAITNGGTSHFGSASLYTAYNNQQPNASISKTNTNNYQPQTGAQQVASSTNSQAFQSSDWVMVTGNQATHTSVGTTFGPIKAPDGGQIASLNNAGVPYTVITKDFFVPVGVKQVTLTFNGNFITNEYPQYVGSKFNDYASVKLTSPSGNVTDVMAFNQALNSSNFKAVSGLPSPMETTGGQTGFKASTATIAVAGGGKVRVEVKVANIGDTAVPSAVLLNKITLK